MKSLVIAAAACGLALVAAGAAGAHMAPGEAAGRWDGSLLYGFVHTLAALAAAFAPLRGRRLAAASGWSFVAGVILFSGIQIAKMMTTSEGVSPLDPLTMLVPVGGIAFMAGWLLLGIAALMQRRDA